MSVRTLDAISFGGFDEHSSYRGYMCGPYDLGWRMVNAGISEVWHDPNIALWHFAHPDPVGSFNQQLTFKLWSEITHPHVDGHALTAVDALSTGRLLPLQENPEVFERRMRQRRIGTDFEAQYARLTGPWGFSKWEKLQLHLALLNPLWQTPILHPFQKLHSHLRKQLLVRGGNWGLKIVQSPFVINRPELILENYKGFNVVFYKNRFFVLALALGPVDISKLDEQTLQEYQELSLGTAVSSFREVREVVSRFRADLSGREPQNLQVQLVVELLERCQSFNIVRYQGKFYGLSLTLGHVDLTQLDEQTVNLYQLRHKLFMTDSLEETRQLINQLPAEVHNSYYFRGIGRYKAKLRTLAQKLKVR